MRNTDTSHDQGARPGYDTGRGTAKEHDHMVDENITQQYTH